MKSSKILMQLMGTAMLFVPQSGSAQAAGAKAPPSDIIVTARRREEALQDVPISVTALSGEALVERGVTNAYDLAANVPSLSVTSAGGFRSNVAYAIRGQRTNEFQLLTDPPVGLYFAEVNQPRTAGFGNAFYDIQSFQVLKGVQGTLFGRNMTGGAVLVEPAHPTDKFEAMVKGSVGNYDLRDIEGMLNVPLGEKAALRFAGKLHRRDGPIIDQSTGRDYGDEHYGTFRISAKLNPTENIEILTIFDRIDVNEHGTGLVGDFYQNSGAVGAYALINAAYAGAFGPSRQIPNDPAFGSFAGLTVLTPVSDLTSQIAAQAAIRNSSNPYRLQGTTAGSGGAFDYPNPGGGALPYERVKNWGITNKINIELSDTLTLKNIFGHRELKQGTFQDLDGLPAPLITSIQDRKVKETSEELQLQGRLMDGRLTFVLGGFYFVEKGRDGSTSQQFPELSTAFGAPNSASLLLVGNRSSGKATSYAGFAAGTFKFTDQWSLSAGIRYTYDKREVVERPLKAPDLTGCAFDPRGLDGVLGTSDDIVVGSDCGVPASKSWDAFTYDATLQYEPNDGLTAYAAYRRGFRSGAFSLRAASAIELRPANPEYVDEYEVGLKTRTNIGSGVLTTSSALFFQNYSNIQRQIVTLSGGVVGTIIDNVARQHIKGGEIEANLRMGAFDIGANYSYVQVKTIKTAPSLAGEFAQIGVPRHQASANVTYHLPLDRELGDIALSGTLSYKSRIYHDNLDVGAIDDPYALLNLRAQWDGIAGSNFSAAVFANNVTDKFYRVGAIGIVAETGIGGSSYGTPRTYGLELSYRF